MLSRILRRLPQPQLFYMAVRQKFFFSEITTAEIKPKKKIQQELMLQDGYLLPLPPKKPASSYLRFLSSVRSDIKQQNPKLNNQGLMKEAAQLFKKEDFKKDLKQELKTKYEEESKKYKELRQQYEEKYKIPRKPASAFTYYVQDQMKKSDKTKTMAETSQKMKQIAEQWKQITEEEKKQYQQKRDEDFKKYQKKIETFDKEFKIPTTCKVSGYNVYQMKNKGDLKEIAAKWSKETEEVKQTFEKQAKQQIESQNNQIKEFCKRKNVSPEDLLKSINKMNKQENDMKKEQKSQKTKQDGKTVEKKSKTKKRSLSTSAVSKKSDTKKKDQKRSKSVGVDTKTSTKAKKSEHTKNATKQPKKKTEKKTASVETKKTTETKKSKLTETKKPKSHSIEPKSDKQ